MKTTSLIFAFVMFAVIWAGCTDNPTIAEPATEELAVPVAVDLSAFEKAGVDYRCYTTTNPAVIKYAIMICDQYGVEVRDVSATRRNWYLFVHGPGADWSAVEAALFMALGMGQI